MLMVVFGAGASYDSCPTYPVGAVPPEAGDAARANDYYRPPLAKDLFANRPIFIGALETFPQCKSIVPRLRDPAVLSGTKSIEAVLQEIEQEAQSYARGLQEMAAVRCYLQSAIRVCQDNWNQTTKGVTNYLYLLREIHRTHQGNDPVCLVTFNYDLILESALAELGFPIRGMEGYTQAALFRVFKLHGSINWAREIDITIPTNVNREHPPAVIKYLVENAGQLTISDRFVLCNPSEMGVVDGRPVFPAIAVPVENKGVFECPQQMMDELTEALPRITKIMTIGWRATEKHFLNLLKAHLQPQVSLSVVAGNEKDAQEVRVRIYRSLTNNQPSAFDENVGFTNFMLTGRAAEILV